MTCSLGCSSSAMPAAYPPCPADRQRRRPIGVLLGRPDRPLRRTTPAPSSALRWTAMPPIARVEPLTTARALRGPFDYRLPEALADVPVGTLLAVPFAGRELLGVVVELAESSDVAPDRLAEPRVRVEPAIP